MTDKKNMKLQPTNAGILVLVDKDGDRKTPTGIVMPGKDETRPCLTGTVVTGGPGTADLPQPYRAGDRVLFHKHMGVDVDHDGKTHRILQAHEVIAVITSE